MVIGGGIAGCSTLYHLTQEGWGDVVLVERDELTSGTTWHSAAQVTNFGPNQTMVGLKSHSINLYKNLAEDPEYPINYHLGDGGIRLANTQAQMDGYRHFASLARGMGVEIEIIDAAECGARHPLITTENLLGGLWDPLDGDIDPAQLCQALARRSRTAGAQIYRQTAVTALTQHRDHSWTVHTDKGEIRAEIVVNAGGYRCNEIAAMMDVDHPVVSMEHQYFLTDPIPQIADAGYRMPLLRCPISDFYCRQDKHGLLVGFYEQGCKTWGLDGIDPNFSMSLCPDDPERVGDTLEGAIARMPVLADVGIHTIVNGPITYSMDGAPLVGPIPGKRNAFCIIGLRAGLGEGGGHGWLLAQQIVHGDACFDTWTLDPRPFTGRADTSVCAARAVEDYQNEFRFHFPHEHRPAGRPVKITPLTPILETERAQFDVVNDWERMAYIKPTADFEEQHSFPFNNTFNVVAGEVDTVCNRVGLAEVNGFTRLELSGRDAHGFLDRMICGRVPHEPGRVGLGYLLNDHGMVKSEATVAILPGGRIWFGSAAAAEWHDRDWLVQHRRADEDVQIRALTNDRAILVLAGPHARDVLSRAARSDWSPNEFPWLSVREAIIATAPVVIMGISFSGELAYEIHVPLDHLQTVYQTLRDAGDAFGLALFGARAIDSMRLEKGFLHWKGELITEYNPIETGLARFVHMGKGDFLGKQALAARQGRVRRNLVMLRLDCRHAPAHAGASVHVGDKVVGTVTSGDWGHRVAMNLAFAFIDKTALARKTAFAVDILGEMVSAEPIAPVPYDPDHTRMRA